MVIQNVSPKIVTRMEKRSALVYIFGSSVYGRPRLINFASKKMSTFTIFKIHQINQNKNYTNLLAFILSTMTKWLIENQQLKIKLFLEKGRHCAAPLKA